MGTSDFPLTITITEALRISELGRTTLYELLKTKKVASTKVGARRLVNYASLAALLKNKEVLL
jgi:excisionase family DNA binding protein